ncbi:glycosyl hydrolase family 95 catalytic domain-containing protein [Streptosporangium sp. KLBMP 9127]|nr:glycoside hydrolase N-terminal domain-containing protein [Streptosporangium sp. KLBMP 9127]
MRTPVRRLGAALAAAVTLLTCLHGQQAAPAQAAAAPDDLTLWYDKPATDWETQTLPIGNGALGASVFGGVTTEQIQFNEKSLWTGGPGSPGYNAGNWTSPRPNAIAEVQAQIDRDARMTPQAVAAKLGQPKTGFGAYQTFGDLWLDMPGGTVTGYRRELSLREAVARVGYTAGGVVHSREYFASHPGNVVVGRISASQAGKVSFTLRTTSPRNDRQVTVSGGRLRIRGTLADNGMRFEAQVQVITQGGSRTDGGDRITVSGADSAVFVLSAGTDYSPAYPSYRGADPRAKVTAAVDQAAGRSFDQLKQAHLDDYRALFDRVRLNIGQQTPTIPTDQLRRAYTAGSSAQDRALEAMYFAYGRYLLIASSRAGSLPANLQGVWNNSTSPPWSADYHVNINLQMNYWPAEQTNLAETTVPYDRYVQSMVAPGRKTAQEMFGSRGWVVHNETNPFGFTGVHDWATSFWFPEAGAWLAQQMYDHYRFGGDVAYLRDVAYPVMKGAAEFWLDNLHTDPRDGKLVVSPSYSPEQGDFSAGASMSQQIVFEILTDSLAAARTLGVDTGFQTEVQTALSRLDTGLRVGSWGQLQEWKTDWDVQNNDHRHVSHLFALHPGRQIATGTAFAAAAKVSLTARGDGGTGWSKAWKINFWARLLDGDHAHKMLGEQLKSSTLDNLWDTHPPFQIDGNFGATSGVAEMLLQSQHDVVHVLPALPAAWPSGSVTGLRARGNVTADVSWRDRKADRITLRAGTAGTLRVRTELATRGHRVQDDQGATITPARQGDTLTWSAQAGRTYSIIADGGTGPCAAPPSDRPVVAWDPVSGTTVADASGSGRPATVTGGASYDSTAPTGSGLVLTGSTYLSTANTTLGHLREATFAAEVKIAGSGYRRLFDSQPSGDPGTDGVLIDVTPSGNLRFIGAGRGVTTDAVLPTGRYLDLVVTLAQNGTITVYVDDVRAGGGTATSTGIVACTARPLRFAVDQNGGQRLTGAVDRMAVLPRALTATEVRTWQDMAF